MHATHAFDLARASEIVPIELDRVTAEGDTHIEWATAIACSIARWRGFHRRSHEEAELVGVALFTLARKRPHFTADRVPVGGDADGQFRGWIHMSVRAECLREAKRLRGGGTFHVPRALHEVIVEGLPTRRATDGFEEVDLADHRVSGPVECAETDGSESEATVPAESKRRWCTRTGRQIAGPFFTDDTD